MDTDNSQLMQCPYDKSHKILAFRFQLHLNRCSRNNTTGKVTCPYNFCHVVDEDELEHHKSVCPSYISPKENDGTFKGSAPPPPLQPIESEENWDDDADAPTYNAELHCQAAPVLRFLKGKTRSERKKFREEEKKRFLKFNNGHDNQTEK